MEEAKSGRGSGVKRIQKDDPYDPLDNERREKVKEAMLHAWNSYEKYAWGQDELQVMQNRSLSENTVYHNW